MNTKLLVGKIFSLKKPKYDGSYWLSEKATEPKYGPKAAGKSYPFEELGNVLIIDERTKKVKILGKNNQMGWIPRFYLHKEVVDNETQNKIILCEIAIKDVQKLFPEKSEDPTAKHLLHVLGMLNNLLRED